MFVDFLWSIARPLLFTMEPERAHDIVMNLLHKTPKLSSLVLSGLCERPIAKEREVGGVRVKSLVGLAAGMDKNAQAIPAWQAMGFGFVEIGTVTYEPQFGNPKPRMFRVIGSESIINKMGFNNIGAKAVAERLDKLYSSTLRPSVPIGINVGKNKSVSLSEAGGNYYQSIDTLRNYADYFVINISSPNTERLRELQNPKHLSKLLRSCKRACYGKPMWVKLSPDMSYEEMQDAVEVIIGEGCSGIVSTNTTNYYKGLGGLSGPGLYYWAKNKTITLIRLVDGRISVIGCGGINSAHKAELMLRLGCDAVQLYTGLVYEGPGLITKINKLLDKTLE